MFVTPAHFLPRLALCAVLLGTGSAAGAACSRPIVVPVSNIGVVMVVDGERISGVYPEVLRTLGEKSGCVFEFQPFPRARSDHMFFDAGTMDVTLPASFVAERAQVATFVPLVKIWPTLVSLKPLPADVVSVKQLLDNKALRGAVVRGFTFGKEYQALVDTLENEGRLDMANDISTVARMLVASRVDFTVVPPHLLRAALANEARGAALLGQFRSQALDGLPLSTVAYISHAARSTRSTRKHCAPCSAARRAKSCSSKAT